MQLSGLCICNIRYFYFTTNTADITLGDAWLPEYMADGMGNNVVIIRNPEIDMIVNEGIKCGKLKMEPVTKDVILKSQAAHYRHTREELAYRLYKKDINKEWRPQKRIEASNALPYFRRKVQDLREEISRQSHIIYKKALELEDFNYFRRKMRKLSKKYKRVYYYMSVQDKGLKGLISVIKSRARKMCKH